MNTVCKKCDHGMMMHGCVDGVGYCMEGNGDWCDCKEKGKVEVDKNIMCTDCVKNTG